MIPSEEARFLLDHLATAVLLFDGEDRLCALNSAAEDLLSCSARKLQGLRVEQALPDAMVFAELVGRVNSTGEPFTERNMQLRVTPERMVSVDCTVTPIFGDDTRSGVMIELVNVEWYQRIVREEHLLLQHHASKALLRGMAHEIKNPLGGIRGAAQLLGKELASDEHREYTRIIIREADRLDKLLDRMLGPKKPPCKAEQNIHRILEHVRGLIEAEAPVNIRIERDYDPSLPNLLADRDQLVQAFLNIVRNAVQAIGNAQGVITLRTRAIRQFTIATTRHRLVLRVDIIDDGPGVAPEIRDEIFYPMVTGRAEGTGLGLPIAQAMIQHQNGLLECESQAGRTVFSCWLPVEAET